MIRFAAVAVVLAIALGVGLFACGQAVGERCQLDRDCQHGLMCQLPPNGTREVGGICEESQTNLDMIPSIDFKLPDIWDSAIPLDFSKTQNPPDMSTID
jgi:hypothetical protein